MCRGDGHTEAIRIEFDPSKMSYQELMTIFFREARGGRCKPQYMSAVWAQDARQKAIAEKLASGKEIPVFDACAWYDAEEYHQKYVAKSRW